MSKKIFIEGTTNTELSITATNDKKIEYFDFSVEESKSKKSKFNMCISNGSCARWIVVS